ncbi:hypothetical protein CONCODRAFT_9762 [Conidiobolus coronatus NRRL 28638]|uniref:Uncharacterized protein n=1 Tax=Conidiobolus coronatus (strain ATCC 28846 / CBS 209.66 / NRRL 28638) TaxID=796925 RepID=A0A137NZ47_CONC2|nr:hypothetical protein CONCODRAFT_9762 [Conidiobolus coronatus NRRL 28638]|eukprot:KXN68037.1 hypothetical protein CONCODRAFT_9762 [Conidiobolus coronatus NRRL 28638]
MPPKKNLLWVYELLFNENRASLKVGKKSSIPEGSCKFNLIRGIRAGQKCGRGTMKVFVYYQSKVVSTQSPDPHRNGRNNSSQSVDEALNDYMSSEFVWDQCMPDQMYVFNEEQVPHILSTVVANMKPMYTREQKLAPANVIFLCARLRKYSDDPITFRLSEGSRVSWGAATRQSQGTRDVDKRNKEIEHYNTTLTYLMSELDQYNNDTVKAASGEMTTFDCYVAINEGANVATVHGWRVLIESYISVFVSMKANRSTIGGSMIALLSIPFYAVGSKYNTSALGHGLVQRHASLRDEVMKTQGVYEFGSLAELIGELLFVDEDVKKIITHVESYQRLVEDASRCVGCECAINDLGAIGVITNAQQKSRPPLVCDFVHIWVCKMSEFHTLSTRVYWLAMSLLIIIHGYEIGNTYIGMKWCVHRATMHCEDSNNLQSWDEGVSLTTA